MIIGRKREQELLNKAYTSNESEFIVVYGRRRVGKTHLIREFFTSKKATLFHATGLQKGGLKQQLKKFTEAISETFFDNTPLGSPKNWDEALGLLDKQIAKINKKIVVFLDEFPWMATRKSGLLLEIDHYWNHRWSKLNNVTLVVCGSSASWLIRKIIYNKGGLHNRVTCEIKLLPFSLSETREYLKSKKVKLNDKHILSIYMALGGIPYYLRYVEPHLSAEQNIQKIIFDKNAPLQDEFNKLFDSLFETADAYVELVKLIAKKKEGLRRAELQSITKFSAGGGSLSKKLKDLYAAGFIEEYISWNRSKGEYYKLVDEFSLFYLHWVAPQKNQRFVQNYWINQSQKSAYYAWSGYAFETICRKHIDQIVCALNINAASTVSAWRFIPRKKSENGAQIDLVIDRNDNAITLCEIKHTNRLFVIDKQGANNLLNKVEIFKKITRTNKQIFIAIIAASGLRSTPYSKELVSNVVTLDDLFAG